MMKKLTSVLLRRCKTLSRQLTRTSSYSSLRSMSARDPYTNLEDQCQTQTVLVGTSRRRYVISSKHLSHPLLNALIERSSAGPDRQWEVSVRCEVVLFDHLLWMLENADPELGVECMEELADLYAY